MLKSEKYRKIKLKVEKMHKNLQFQKFLFCLRVKADFFPNS